MAQIRTEFLDPGELRDGELRLIVAERIPADPVTGHVAAYELAMMHAPSDECIGRLGLRLGDSEFLVKYAGQIGYEVDPAHRGHRYAARSCLLVLPLVRAHGFAELWITCTPDNIASRRTCELVGGELVEIVDLPADCDMYAEGERRKCRYRIAL